MAPHSMVTSGRRNRLIDVRNAVSADVGRQPVARQKYSLQRNRHYVQKRRSAVQINERFNGRGNTFFGRLRGCWRFIFFAAGHQQGSAQNERPQVLVHDVLEFGERANKKLKPARLTRKMLNCKSYFKQVSSQIRGCAPSRISSSNQGVTQHGAIVGANPIHSAHNEVPSKASPATRTAH